MFLKKLLSIGFAALLFMSMVMLSGNVVPATKLHVNTYLPCWTYWTFGANVNVTDVEDLYSFELKLAWNKTVLDLIKVNIMPPEEWQTNYVIFKNETLQNYNGTHGRYWLNMSALAPAPSFNGSTILVNLTFLIKFRPWEPEPGIWCRLDLYDTKLSDPEGLPIPHEADDGFYFIYSDCPCWPELEVTPSYYEATALGENFTISIYTLMFSRYFFTGWEAKLGYNTTLLDVLRVEEGPFLGKFREADKRYFTASVNEEEGYVNMTGGILTKLCSIPAGYGSLAKITFNATYVAQCSEDGTCLLDLYDTNITSNWEWPKSHFVYDGSYRAPHAELVGDLNQDGRISITDIVMCALAFGCCVGDPCYIPYCDMNGDGCVTITDIVIIALHFGECCKCVT